MTKKELVEALGSKSSSKRQKAIKHIERNKLKSFGDQLFALLKSLDENSDGSTQAEYFERFHLCIAMATLEYRNAIPFLERKAREGGSIDSLGAGMSHLRLIRRDQKDISEYFNYFDAFYAMVDEGKYTALARAALGVMCNDKIVPSPLDQDRFVEFAWKHIDRFPENDRDASLIASTCAGFDPEKVKGLLY